MGKEEKEKENITQMRRSKSAREKKRERRREKNRECACLRIEEGRR